jgi:hypothetical protein
MLKRAIYLGTFASFSVLVSGFSAGAAPVTLTDNYYGGLNTYNNNYPVSGDVIGTSAFDIMSAVVNRTGNNLEVVINTNYVQNIGDSGTGLGALFLGNGTPSYNNAADSSKAITTPFAYDEFSANPGRFQYAVSLPTKPILTSGHASGNGTVYALNGTGSDVQLSNVNGNTLTYPNNPSSGFYFRTGQAVGVNNTAVTTTQGGVSATWSINATADTLTFDISNIFNNLLGSTFTLAWEITCANDVILASVTLPGDAPAPNPTPLPAAFPLFAGGLGVIGFLSSRRRKKLKATAVA